MTLISDKVNEVIDSWTAQGGGRSGFTNPYPEYIPGVGIINPQHVFFDVQHSGIPNVGDYLPEAPGMNIDLPDVNFDFGAAEWRGMLQGWWNDTFNTSKIFQGGMAAVVGIGVGAGLLYLAIKGGRKAGVF